VDNVAGIDHLCRGFECRGAGLDELIATGGCPVPHGDLDALAEEGRGHLLAHDAESEETDLHSCREGEKTGWGPIAVSREQSVLRKRKDAAEHRHREHVEGGGRRRRENRG